MLTLSRHFPGCICAEIMRRFSQTGSRIVRDPRSAQRYPRNMLVALPVPKPLSAFVDGIWTHTGSTRPYRVLPDGCLDFIFSLESGTASVVGPMSRAIVVPARSGVTFFGVRFRPGHAARFLDTHASELSDEQAALSTITRLATLAELEAAEQALASARVIVPRRKTFHGATEIWWEIENGVILGLAEHS
jgi:hypothetical protein